MKKKIKVFLQKNNLSFLITKTRYIRFFHFFIVGYYLLKRKKPIRVHGGLFFFPEKTNAINIGKYFFGFYERSEFRLIKKFIEPSDVVLELGANIGIMSNIINDLLLNKKNQVSVEANPYLISLLEINKSLNNSMFKIENSLISNKENIFFYVNDNNLSSSIYEKTSNRIEVNSISLNELIEKYNITFNTLIMDIEGAEIDFILNNDLSIFDKILIEFHPSKTGEKSVKHALEILITQNFRLIQKVSNVQCWKKIETTK